MGCDIHVYLEKKTVINNVTKWVNIDYWRLNPYYDGVDNMNNNMNMFPYT